jgi:UDP-N-acetylmuramoyl-tripeptide--D-alanyl-D-alanine ligase
MKNLIRSLLVALLAFCARVIVRRYKPQIVMVTGSVGKTSTKDAIAAALGQRVFVRASEKSFNTEFGVPLTVIGAKNPWGSPLGWATVFKEAFALMILPNHYPKLLVLEVGADRPGDLAKTLKIATPDAVVVTSLPDVPVHVEAYASPEAVRDEEFAPAYALASGAPLVISADDANARRYAARVSASVRTFGFAADADVRVEDADASEKPGMEGILVIEGAKYPLTVRGALGRTQLLAPAAAVAVSRALGLTTEEALAGLTTYTPPPGRMRLFNGKNNSVLIDDTYNASPTATLEALDALKAAGGKRHIAALADMLELGRYSVAEHERIGAQVAECADVLVAVGIRARKVAEAAKAAGMKADSIHEFDDSRAAAGALSMLIQTGDVILIKGSQSMRMERVTEALLADPRDRADLVRQDSEWKKR